MAEAPGDRGAGLQNKDFEAYDRRHESMAREMPDAAGVPAGGSTGGEIDRDLGSGSSLNQADSRPPGHSAAEEIAPREVEAGAGRTASPEPPVGTRGAVDENRPADVVAQQLSGGGITSPAISPNVMQRQHVIAPGGNVHTGTAGQELAAAEEDTEQG